MKKKRREITDSDVATLMNLMAQASEIIEQMRTISQEVWHPNKNEAVDIWNLGSRLRQLHYHITGEWGTPRPLGGIKERIETNELK